MVRNIHKFLSGEYKCNIRTLLEDPTYRGESKKKLKQKLWSKQNQMLKKTTDNLTPVCDNLVKKFRHRVLAKIIHYEIFNPPPNFMTANEISSATCSCNRQGVRLIET